MSEYTTTDLGLASFLFAKGVAYKGLRERPGDWKVEFCFDQPDVSLIAGWQSGAVEVRALAMWNASRQLAREVKRRERA